MPETTPRVLVAEQSLTNRTLIREVMSAFLHCAVDDASSAEHAYERALMKPYRLFIFSLALPDMSGILLDRLLAKVYAKVHTKQVVPPPVIFLVPGTDMAAYRAVERDARVLGGIPLPLNLDLLMNAARTVLPPLPRTK